MQSSGAKASEPQVPASYVTSSKLPIVRRMATMVAAMAARGVTGGSGPLLSATELLNAASRLAGGTSRGGGGLTTRC